MKLRHRIGAALAGAALLVTGGVVADSTVKEVSSASASWGTSVRVAHGIPYSVPLRHMDGRIFNAYPNVTYTNIAAVYIWARECLSIGGYVYCAGSSARWQYIYQQKTYNVYYVV